MRNQTSTETVWRFAQRCLSVFLGLIAAFACASGGLRTYAGVADDIVAGAGSLQSFRTARFYIVHDRSQRWAGELGVRLEELADRFYEEITAWAAVLPEQSSDRRMEWLCVGASPAEGRPVRLDASYDTRLHRVTLKWEADGRIRQSGATESAFEPLALTAIERDEEDLCMRRLSHEMGHQLSYDSGLQTRGVMYPLWLAEGLATNLEMPDGGMKFLGPNTRRQMRLLALAAEERLLPLAYLAAVTNTRDFTREERVDLYAQAWGFFRFLAQERKADLVGHFQLLAALPFGPRTADQLRSELVATFGPFDELDQAWRRWLSRL